MIIFVLTFAFLSGCTKDKSVTEQEMIADLLNKWGTPQSEEIVNDFYDGWDFIGEGADKRPAEKDIDEALDAMYVEYFTEEGWTYFLSFMLPTTIAATENSAELSIDNIVIEVLSDGYDAMFDLKYKKQNAPEVQTITSGFRFYFKDGKICKIDVPMGMITPQFFVDEANVQLGPQHDNIVLSPEDIENIQYQGKLISYEELAENIFSKYKNNEITYDNVYVAPPEDFIFPELIDWDKTKITQDEMGYYNANILSVDGKYRMCISINDNTYDGEEIFEDDFVINFVAFF